MLKMVICIFMIWFGKNGGLERARLSARCGSATPPPSHLEPICSHPARKQTFSLHEILAFFSEFFFQSLLIAVGFK